MQFSEDVVIHCQNHQFNDYSYCITIQSLIGNSSPLYVNKLIDYIVLYSAHAWFIIPKLSTLRLKPMNTLKNSSFSAYEVLSERASVQHTHVNSNKNANNTS